MKWIKSIFLTISTMFAGMYGGQKNKGVRRFGIPGLAVVSAFFQGLGWRSLAFLLLIPVLVMGYGESSFLGELIGVDWLVRIVYAMLLSIPFIFFGIKRFGVACISLIIAFQVRAGSLGHISWFGDILIEDMIRYGVLGALISFNIFFRRKR